jgi:hypothetical protein
VEIAAHFEEVYGAKVSKDTISRITEKVAGELAEWSARPLDPIYPVLFVDAVVVKVRDGQVRNTPFYVVMGVTVNGEREILGIWAGDGGEGARFWLQVFSELKNRGVEDVLIAVCDGLKGLPEAPWGNATPRQPPSQSRSSASTTDSWAPSESSRPSAGRTKTAPKRSGTSCLPGLPHYRQLLAGPQGTLPPLHRQPSKRHSHGTASCETASYAQGLIGLQAKAANWLLPRPSLT